MLIRACSSKSIKTKKRVLNDLQETFGSDLSDASYDSTLFDVTDDDLLSDKPKRQRGRRSDDHKTNLDKFHRSSDAILNQSKGSFLDNSFQRPIMSRRLSTTRHRRRSALESLESCTNTDDSFWNTFCIQTPKVNTPNEINFSTNSPIPNLVIHAWERKSLRKMMEKCSACTKHINWGNTVSKCKSCGLTVHEKCESSVKLSCKCTAENLTLKRDLSEYIFSDAKPKIPACIYLSIHEVEKRLEDEGIYRMNGSKIECEHLKSDFISGKVTSEGLGLISDTNTICSSIKDFFRNMLKEPLLTNRHFNTFKEAFLYQDEDLLKKAILSVS